MSLAAVLESHKKSDYSLGDKVLCKKRSSRGKWHRAEIVDILENLNSRLDLTDDFTNYEVQFIGYPQNQNETVSADELLPVSILGEKKIKNRETFAIIFLPRRTATKTRDLKRYTKRKEVPVRPCVACHKFYTMVEDHERLRHGLGSKKRLNIMPIPLVTFSTAPPEVREYPIASDSNFKRVRSGSRPNRRLGLSSQDIDALRRHHAVNHREMNEHHLNLRPDPTAEEMNLYYL